ncbi:hypothetical protein [Agrobacterium tumefaciens]|uniref:hypothetical protein n=1 Tax=Agrobacterium tumefaciens TaxID=358 RepID=UPI001574815A|nr:hypothetical protein [Agrobacterium tumefaciens]WCJ63812.1 hypothetical protein G6M15_06355 [Agrobacterium tumefaciens]
MKNEIKEYDDPMDLVDGYKAHQHYIRKAIAVDETPEWKIIDLLFERLAYLYTSDECFIVVEYCIDTITEKRFCHVRLVGGPPNRSFDIIINHMDWLEQTALKYGYPNLSYTGRKGWMKAFKKLGWVVDANDIPSDPKLITMIKELKSIH